uniref:Synaptobrevin, longin-like domain protein n=1 Tax=Tanacetum cinerariifolium TaxID=118510 RepID=A0A6L2LIQ2_TANCI|nr:hypothetical protein [Tanacetum cinerariifolium]
MSSAFADTYNMVAILAKFDAIKHSTDVTRLQALVDRKKVVISDAVIREVLRLDDAEGVDYLPNEEIFTGLARMGFVRNVESSSKFYMYPRFIQLIIQNQIGDLSTHSTKYISPALTQKVLTNMRRIRKGFSRVETPLFEGMLVVREDMVADIREEHILDDTVVAAAQEVVPTAALEDVLPAVLEDVHDEFTPSPAPPTPLPRLSQDIPSISQAQSPPTQPQSSTPAQPQGADFPISLLQTALDACAALTLRVEHLEHDKKAQTLKITKLKKRVTKLERVNKGRMIVELDRDEEVELIGDKEKSKEVKDIVGDAQVKRRQGRQAKKQAKIYQIDLDHPLKVLSMQEDDSEVQEAVTIIPTAKPIVLAATPIVIPVTAAYSRRRKRVIIRDPKEESTPVKSDETKSKDKGKGILIEEPKPIKKKDQLELNEEYQVMKKRPQTKAQARKNMMIYLKNTEGFKLDYFKRQSYDDIRLLFEAKFNKNLEFLMKSKEKIEAKEVKDLKQHLEIVLDEDDDVYTEATPLARKVPVVGYQVILVNNKPQYKIIRVDGTHQLYTSFLTLLKNFDRDDLETLWNIVKERFSTSKPNNFSDEYLLTTLKMMFGRPDGQDNGRIVGLKLLLILLILLLAFRVDAAKELEENTKCFSAAGEELSPAKHKLMLLSEGQSLHASRPSKLCARARSVDDMPYRTQASKEYIRWVF